ncbi:hypothetical protein ACWCQR_51860, partial [Streptomyces sp. NPDC002172]
MQLPDEPRRLGPDLHLRPHTRTAGSRPLRHLTLHPLPLLPQSHRPQRHPTPTHTLARSVSRSRAGPARDRTPTTTSTSTRAGTGAGIGAGTGRGQGGRTEPVTLHDQPLRKPPHRGRPGPH